MQKRIFISYKYPEGIKYRDRLIKKLDENAFKYLGEDEKNQDISHMDVAAIGKYLSDMIYSTDVTVVLITPEVLYSEWIPWEVWYSLKEIRRKNRNSSRNGIVGVVCPKENGRYDYVIKKKGSYNIIDQNRLPDIITENMYNANNASDYSVEDSVWGSYISIVRWNEFIEKKNEMINNAYLKATQMIGSYDLKINF